MIESDADTVRVTVVRDFQAALPHLDPRLANWVRVHVVAPRAITLARRTDGGNTEDFWLVTDHKGTDDADFRLVYDDVAQRYGIECAIQNNISLFIGYRENITAALADIKVVDPGPATSRRG